MLHHDSLEDSGGALCEDVGIAVFDLTFGGNDGNLASSSFRRPRADFSVSSSITTSSRGVPGLDPFVSFE